MTGWTLQVVEPDGTAVGDPLDCAPGGTVTISLPEAGGMPHRITALTIHGPIPDLKGRLLRDRWAGDPGPGETWLPIRETSRALSDAASARTMAGVDVTGLLARARLSRDEIMAPGTDVSDWTGVLLDRYLPAPYRRLFSVADVDTSIRDEQVFGPGSTLLEATAGPLSAAAMTPWTPLPNGTAVATGWAPAAQRPVVETFGDETAPPDAAGFYGDGWDVDPDDVAPLDNEVLAVVRATGDLPQIVGRWADEADIYATGRRTVVVPGQVEATDQRAADLIAARYAEEHVRRRAEISFDGPFRPIRPGQIARVVWAKWGIDGLFELVSKTVQRNVAADTRYVLREV